VDLENCPYIGPVPFKREDGERFFGRDSEVADLLSLVASYPATLLYAQSGAGKTSLLAAKFIPLFEARGAKVFGPLRVSGVLPEVKKSAIENPYRAHLLVSAGIDPKKALKMTLTEFLASRPAQLDETKIPPLRVLVIDQFEELFTTNPEQWMARYALFRELGHCLADDSRLRVLIAMREEWVASIEQYSHELPDALRPRFRLERLRSEAALEAVRNPLELSGMTFHGGAAEQLVARLRGAPATRARPDRVPLLEFVEPLHLQIVCRRMWSFLPDGTKTITTKALRGSDDVEEALLAYYDDCVKAIVATERITEGRLRNEFERSFIAPDGNRTPLRASTVEKGTASLTANVVDRLLKLYLVRTETRSNSVWYELSHDRFVEPVLRSNETFRRGQDRSSFYGRLDKQAQEWSKRGKPTTDRELLLSREDLRPARGFVKRPDVHEYRGADVIIELVTASETLHARDRDHSRTRWLTVLLVVILVTGAITVYSMFSARKANELALVKAETQVAQEMLSEGKPLDGMAWAVKAISKREGTKFADAKKVLLDAVKASTQSIWIPRRGETVDDARFSPDNALLLTSTARELCLWEAATGRLRACNPNPIPPNPFGSPIVFSEGGRWLIATPQVRDLGAVRAVASGEVRAVVFETKSGHEDKPLTQLLSNAEAWAFSANDSRLAVTFDDGSALVGTRPPSLAVYETRTMTQVKINVKPTFSVHLTPDGEFVVVVGADQSMTVYEAATLKESAAFKRQGFLGFPGVLAVSPPYAALTMYFTDFVQVYDLKKGFLYQTRTGVGAQSRFLPGGKLALFSRQMLRVVNAADGRELQKLMIPKAGTVSNGAVVTREESGADTIVKIYEPLRRDPISRILLSTKIDGLTLSPDHKSIATRSGSVARIWPVKQEDHDYTKSSVTDLRKVACDELRRLQRPLPRDIEQACQARP
jgi:hypothetical protein